MGSDEMCISNAMQIFSEEMYNYMPLSPKPRAGLKVFAQYLNKFKGLTTHTTDEMGQTVAFYLAREGVVPALEAATKLKANLTHRDNDGNTMLHAACQCQSIVFDTDGDPPAVVDFLKETVDINTPNTLGNTPLFEIVPYVREHRRDIGEPSQCQRLADFLEHLVSCGADIHHRNTKGQTFVHGFARLPSHVREVFEPYAALIQQKTLNTVATAVHRPSSLRPFQKI